eukprot:6260326-Amphidinium_carterae.2
MLRGYPHALDAARRSRKEPTSMSQVYLSPSKLALLSCYTIAGDWAEIQSFNGILLVAAWLNPYCSTSGQSLADVV